MGIPFGHIDDMNLYEFRLYQEGYRMRMKDQASLFRPVAYYSLIGPGNIKNAPTMDEFWPLDDKPSRFERVKKKGTEKWSQKKIQETNDYFTRIIREQNGSNKR